MDLKFSYNVIIACEEKYEGCSTPMVGVINYKILSITDKTVKPEEYFINLYHNECL